MPTFWSFKKKAKKLDTMPTEHFDDVEFFLDLEEPPREVVDWAKENLGESEDKKVAQIHELREMIYEKGDVTAHRTDDAFLLRFLRSRCFNVQSAYKVLVNYYNFKSNNRDFWEKVEPLNLTVIGEEDIIAVVPYREQTGRRMMIYKLGNWNPSEVSITDMFRGTLALLELGILEQRAQVLGGICIFDLKGISLSHAWQVTPSVAAKVVQLMVTSFPLKVYALHIIFESWVFDIIFQMFKPLLDDKMKNKIFFHGSDVQSLHNHIDPKYLPRRYGGTRPHYKYRKWFEGFRRDERIIKEVVSLGYVVQDKDLGTKFWDSDEDDIIHND